MAASSLASLTSLVACAAMLCACAAPIQPAAFAGRGPEMRPEAFFSGETRSTGVLSKRIGAASTPMQVRGQGTLLPDGSLRLEQNVSIGDAAPQNRTWVMRRLDAHRYAATLTDASGPVEGEAYGNVLHLRYPMKSPFVGQMEQWLTLQPDGRTVLNEATVRVFGVAVAHLSERITHEAP